MKNDIEKLEILMGKRVVDIDTEISMVAPTGSNQGEIQIEIPLRLIFDRYSLLIYNQWSIISSRENKINDLKQTVIEEILIENGILSLRLDNSDIIKVNLNDNGYTGPEAMVLYGPENLIIVWN